MATFLFKSLANGKETFDSYYQCDYLLYKRGRDYNLRFGSETEYVVAYRAEKADRNSKKLQSNTT
jgi:hypothetical protein